MIRITQTYIINMAIKYLQQHGWDILYVDCPGGRRSGVGFTAKINALWEQIYNLSPDIVATHSSDLVIFEVDDVLSDDYYKKFQKYLSKKDKLIKEIEKLTSKKISRLLCGFVSKKDRIIGSIDTTFSPFYYLKYQSGKIVEKLFNDS